ncbi:MAG: phenylacetate--CoA ligase family protein [Bacillota bacterium]
MNSGEMKLKLLNRTLKRCEKSEFYRGRPGGKSLKSLDDLKGIPLTTKDDLRNNSPYGLICAPRRALVQYHESFGTTGVPVSIWLTREDLRRNAKIISYWGVGFNADDTVLIRYPYAISGVAHMVHAGAQRKKACVIPASSRTAVCPFPRIVSLMRKLGVTVLAGLPLQALLIAETAELMGYRPGKDFPMLRALCTAGEPLSPWRRKLLEDIWGVPVFDNYGLTETGPLALDCEFGHLHPLEDDYIFEILRDDFQTPSAENECGYLVITTLCREGTPLLRYLTGDLVRMVEQDCPCGSRLTMEVHGRSEQRISAGPAILDIWDLDEIVSFLPYRRFWIAAPAQDGIKIVLEEEPESGPLHYKKADSLETRFGVRVHLEIVPKGTLFNRSKLLETAIIGKPAYIVSPEELAEKKQPAASVL